MKKIIFKYLFLFCVSCSYGQKITGNIYSDSLMIKSIPKVKIIFKSLINDKKKCVKSDKNGNFSFSVDNSKIDCTVLIEKKGYIPIEIDVHEDLSNNSMLYFKVVLKKELSIHDEDFDGISKIISIEKIGDKN